VLLQLLRRQLDVATVNLLQASPVSVNSYVEKIDEKLRYVIEGKIQVCHLLVNPDCVLDTAHWATETACNVQKYCLSAGIPLVIIKW